MGFPGLQTRLSIHCNAVEGSLAGLPGAGLPLLLGLLQAVKLNKPWVLDPVGCGATTYRTAACVNMLKLQPTVVRGNASEILALAGAAGTAWSAAVSAAGPQQWRDAMNPAMAHH
jgi:hydroxyethylthiazole kinase